MSHRHTQKQRYMPACKVQVNTWTHLRKCEDAWTHLETNVHTGTLMYIQMQPSEGKSNSLMSQRTWLDIDELYEPSQVLPWLQFSHLKTWILILVTSQGTVKINEKAQVGPWELCCLASTSGENGCPVSWLSAFSPHTIWVTLSLPQGSHLPGRNNHRR